jgi:hypothetical protein
MGVFSLNTMVAPTLTLTLFAYLTALLIVCLPFRKKRT